MAEDIRIESHKLIYHPQTVSHWLNGENIYPIELEVSLSSGCNHRCEFCSFEYMSHKSAFLDRDVWTSNLKQLHEKGLKSIVYAGDGEPFLHKDCVDIIRKTKENNIDVAASTNGVYLVSDAIEECLSSLTWIRFSSASITDRTYNSIQRGRPGDLGRVLDNLQYAVDFKRKNAASTTIGVQLILLPENKPEVVKMAEELKRIGVDYFTVKPFMQHPQNAHLIQVDYKEAESLKKEVEKLRTDDYQVFFRAQTMKDIQCDRGYDTCWALPFMAYVNAKGDVYSCIRILGREELRYGNLYEKNFCEIWEGEQRRKSVERLMDMDLDSNCGKTCRMDQMNKYLQGLKHPGAHVNFI